MNTEATKQKMDWLKDHEFTIIPFDITGVTVAHNPFTNVNLHFTSTHLQADTPKGPFCLEGWIKLDISSFSMVCLGLGIVGGVELDKLKKEAEKGLITQQS
jgi:hypothetical protein